MEYTFRFLLYLLPATLLMPLWQVNVGVTIFAYNIVGAIFITLYFIRALYRLSIPKLNNRLAVFFLFLSLLLFVKVLSIFGALKYSYLSDAYLIQYLKGVLSEIFIYILLVSVVLYLVETGYQSKIIIIRSFIITIFAACFYQFISLVCLIYFQINLDKIVWSLISYNIDIESFNMLETGVIGINDFLFYRVGSFLGNPNAFASVLVIAISFMSISYFENDRKIYLMGLFIMIMALLFTVSRSGILGLVISFTLMFIIYFKEVVRKHKIKIAFLIAICSLAYLLFSSEILNMLRLDPTSSILGSRSELYLNGLEAFSNRPIFGYGLNNSPLVLDNYDIVNIVGRDFHNYYLTILIEIGLIGLILHVVFFIYMILNFKRENVFSVTLSIALIALLFINLFNSTLSNPYIYFFIYLFYAMSVLNSKSINNLRKSPVTSLNKHNVNTNL